jgi:hypothetical protein
MRLTKRVQFLLLAAAFVNPAHAVAQKATDGSAKILVGPNLRASSNETAEAGDRNECWISASRTVPGFLVGVSQTFGAGRNCVTLISRNGGQTWREVDVSLPQGGCFDTMTAAAPDGRIYVMQPMIGTNFGFGPSALEKGEIRMYSTADQGKTWQGPGVATCPMAEDHPRIVVDDSDGPHRGRLYLEWNEVADSVLKNRFNLFLQYSEDQGKTFSDATLVTTAVAKGGKLVATEPIVLSDGTLLITYYQFFLQQADLINQSEPFYIVRSTDGGKTLSEPSKVITLATSAWRHKFGDYGGAFTLPIVTADTSAASRFRDRVYITWEDTRDGNANIWFIKSENKGVSWSEPKRLNDNSTTAGNASPDFRETPVVAVNKDGVIGVAWYDFRDDPAHLCWRQYFTASLDGGNTFLPNIAVSNQPSCPEKATLSPNLFVWNSSPDVDENRPSSDKQTGDTSIGEELLRGEQRARQEHWGKIGKPTIDLAFNRSTWPGHYTGLTADSNGVFHPLWSDRRDVVQQLYTATVEVTTSPLPSPVATQPTDVTKLIQVITGPAKYDGQGETTFDLQLRNVSGQTIYAPLILRATQIVGAPGRPSAVFKESDSKDAKSAPSWNFSKLLGAKGRLEPGMVSEVKKIKVRTAEATGMDGEFYFEVVGGIPHS